MFWLRRALPLALLIMLVLGIVPAQSQPPTNDDTCPIIVDKALTAVGDHCRGLTRNQACYGYVRVDATFAGNVDEDIFSEPADITEITTLRSLHTTALDPEEDLWGVAVLNVQANVPLTLPGQAVTILLLGNTQIENQVDADKAFIPRDPVPVVVVSDERVNLRSGPGMMHNVVMSIEGSGWLMADGISLDGDWVRVFYQNAPAWIYRPLVRSSLPWMIDRLQVVEAEMQTPMQSFYFTTGLGIPRCSEAPDAVVIQGPQNLTVNLTVNWADITIGSTVVLQSDTWQNVEPANGEEFADDCRLTQIVILDGSADLLAGDFSLPAGYMADAITCPDEDGELVQQGSWNNINPAPPQVLQQFQTLEQLPQGVLRYPIVIPEPEEIEPPPPTPEPTPTLPPRPTS
jgi:hypothetical protein